MKFKVTKEEKQFLRYAKTMTVCKNENCFEKEEYFYFPFFMKETEDEEWISIVSFSKLPDSLKEKVKQMVEYEYNKN